MSLTIGILSWGASKTLISTLDSYLSHELDQVDDIIIFFQEMSDNDERIAKGRGIPYFGESTNIGIAGGYRRLVEQTTSDFFLFLENDWLLIEDPHIPLGQAKYLIGTGEADIVRLRHRTDPGSPLWTRQFEGRETEKLTHLLDCVHWRTAPDRNFPQYIRRKEIRRMLVEPISLTENNLVEDDIARPQIVTDDWFITRSTFANWTNNPHIAKTDFLKEHILPHMGDRNLEQDIQSWWETQDFKVAQGQGLFKHWRID